MKLGKRHPDPVVETASLSSVEPTDVTYKLSIPPETINSGLLSALQLESITYASQAHEQLLPDGSRAGFLIGLLIAVSDTQQFHLKNKINSRRWSWCWQGSHYRWNNLRKLFEGQEEGPLDLGIE